MPIFLGWHPNNLNQPHPEVADATPQKVRPIFDKTYSPASNTSPQSSASIAEVQGDIVTRPKSCCRAVAVNVDNQANGVRTYASPTKAESSESLCSEVAETFQAEMIDGHSSKNRKILQLRQSQELGTHRPDHRQLPIQKDCVCRSWWVASRRTNLQLLEVKLLELRCHEPTWLHAR